VASALIGLGSNIEPLFWLRFAAQRIAARFPDARFSSVYRSPAFGMEGPDFLNACAWLPQAPQEGALTAWLKALEDEAGRDRSQGSWRPRTLDLDLLAYGDEVRDPELFQRAYLWLPAVEVWPALATRGAGVREGAQRLDGVSLLSSQGTSLQSPAKSEGKGV